MTAFLQAKAPHSGNFRRIIGLAREAKQCGFIKPNEKLESFALFLELWCHNHPGEFCGRKYEITHGRLSIKFRGSTLGRIKLMPENARSRTYILWDARACADQGTDDSTPLDSGLTYEAAKRLTINDHGAGAVYSYQDDGKELTDERWEWDIR